MNEDTLRTWLRGEVRAVLDRKTSPPPLMLWCDPDRAWRDLLTAAAEGGAYELWAEGDHELILRDRLLKTAPAPRVVWIPPLRPRALGPVTPGACE